MEAPTTATSAPPGPTAPGHYVVDTEPVDYARLARRLGPALLRERLRRQRGRYELLRQRHPDPDRMTHDSRTEAWAMEVLSALGWQAWARAEFLALRVQRHRVCLPLLPPALAGFRILQLADLHLDLDPELLPALQRRLAGLRFDAVVLTGDFRNRTVGPAQPALEALRVLMAGWRVPIFGVLGNHDFVEMVPALERLGVRMLLNEHAALERDGAALYLAGIDDPQHYETHDLEAARRGVPEDACVVLLSHGPRVWREAARMNYSLMLAGHTHGGQICLPGGVPIFRNGLAPKRFCRGPWSWQGLRGYTSVGAGACGLPARLCCPSEIVIHELYRDRLPPLGASGKSAERA